MSGVAVVVIIVWANCVWVHSFSLVRGEKRRPGRVPQDLVTR